MQSDTTAVQSPFEIAISTRPFNLRLRSLLTNLQCTHAEVAKLLNISQSHLARLYAGQVSMSPALAVRIEKVTGTPAERLIIWQSLTLVSKARQASRDSGD